MIVTVTAIIIIVLLLLQVFSVVSYLLIRKST